MRTKPVRREEVRFDEERITTLPADSLRQGQFDREPIPKLWAPLLRSLKAKQPWPYSRGKRKCRHCGCKFYRVPGGQSRYCCDQCDQRRALYQVHQGALGGQSHSPRQPQV